MRKVLCLIVLSLLVLMDSRFLRPFWLDEVLQFPMGAYDSLFDAMHAFRGSLRGNHGQTGFHFFLSFLSLKVFGASFFGFRFPSILAGIMTLLGALTFFRTIKVGAKWAWIGVLTIFITPGFSSFVGEVRPYILLINASVGTLAYYLSTQSERKTLWIRFLGYESILLGCVSHPYFAIYWPFAVVFGFFWRHGTLKSDFKEIGNYFEFVHLPLMVLGILLFFIIGKNSWMIPPEFSFKGGDSYLYLRPGVPLWQTILAAHFEFLEYLRPLKRPYIIIVFAVGLLWIFNKGFRVRVPHLGHAFALMIASLIISGILASISLQQGYWILPRQWVASNVLLVLGNTWFLSLLGGIVSVRFSRITSIVLVGLVGILTAAHVQKLSTMWNQDFQWSQTPQGIAQTQFNPENFDESTGEWVWLANANALQGGRVWPVFRKFYGEH